MSRRWTYKVVEVKAPFLVLKSEVLQDTLNQLGLQGWELVSVVQASPADATRLYFKKPA